MILQYTMIGLGDTVEHHKAIAIRMRSSERYEILKKTCAIKSGKTVQPKERNHTPPFNFSTALRVALIISDYKGNHALWIRMKTKSI